MKIYNLFNFWEDFEDRHKYFEELEEQTKRERLEEIYINPNTDWVNRRIILVGEKDDVFKLSMKPNWLKLIPAYTANLITTTASFGGINLLKGSKIKEYQHDMIPAITINEASEHFDFPPEHPQNMVAYVTTSIDDKYYVPLASYDKYLLDSKRSALIELCASLNAKEILLTSFVLKGKEYDGKAMLSKIPTKYGFIDSEGQRSYRKNKEKKELVMFKFNKPSKAVSFYDNPWIDSEPSWKTLRKLRLENNLSQFNTELNISEDFILDYKMVSKINKIGIEIGGTYKKFEKQKYNLKINFW